ncbi:hypothetical protein MHK_010293, partial [Candidatus Magnetomorum sp. HK-1]
PTLALGKITFSLSLTAMGFSPTRRFSWVCLSLTAMDGYGLKPADYMLQRL